MALQEELTLKELILSLKDYYHFFIKKWYWFVIIALIIGGAVGYSNYIAPVTYKAPLTFVLNGNKETSIGGGGLLGSLGLKGGDGSGNSAIKLIEMARSRQLLARVLFDSVTIEERAQFIADHLIEQYSYHDDWVDNPELNGFIYGDRIPSKDDLKGNMVLKMLHRLLINSEDGLLSIDFNELSGIFSIRTNSLNPELSLAITKGVYDELADYYTTTTITGKQQTLNELRQRADSIKIVLATAEARLAQFQDRSGGISLRSNYVAGEQLKRDALILSTMYVEIVKNRETSAFLLANEKPSFSIIDVPLEPLESSRGNWKRGLAMGAALGVFLTTFVLFFVKLVRDALSS